MSMSQMFVCLPPGETAVAAEKAPDDRNDHTRRPRPHVKAERHKSVAAGVHETERGRAGRRRTRSEKEG